MHSLVPHAGPKLLSVLFKDMVPQDGKHESSSYVKMAPDPESKELLSSIHLQKDSPECEKLPQDTIPPTQRDRAREIDAKMMLLPSPVHCYRPLSTICFLCCHKDTHKAKPSRIQWHKCTNSIPSDSCAERLLLKGSSYLVTSGSLPGTLSWTM